jgi:hypothetical protein
MNKVVLIQDYKARPQRPAAVLPSSFDEMRQELRERMRRIHGIAVAKQQPEQLQ